ncbi:hypothetical protein AK812_SmicGene2579 [Symbiodinium microadriaticum]|uniref:Uncharacterized protein n=1 Tax=Symbiodinium microadriaticum TaxID=2951 RepID=A0A1Q9F1C8_SYMMI|nr:hypothetical protein AK812_SmicGene2579 [Symbiodinium microadriaticum]
MELTEESRAELMSAKEQASLLRGLMGARPGAHLAVAATTAPHKRGKDCETGKGADKFRRSAMLKQLLDLWYVRLEVVAETEESLQQARTLLILDQAGRIPYLQYNTQTEQLELEIKTDRDPLELKAALESIKGLECYKGEATVLTDLTRQLGMNLYVFSFVDHPLKKPIVCKRNNFFYSKFFQQEAADFHNKAGGRSVVGHWISELRYQPADVGAVGMMVLAGLPRLDHIQRLSKQPDVNEAPSEGLVDNLPLPKDCGSLLEYILSFERLVDEYEPVSTQKYQEDLEISTLLSGLPQDVKRYMYTQVNDSTTYLGLCDHILQYVRTASTWSKLKTIDAAVGSDMMGNDCVYDKDDKGKKGDKGSKGSAGKVKKKMTPARLAAKELGFLQPFMETAEQRSLGQPGDGITTMTSASASSAPAQLPQADQPQDSGDKGGEMSVDDVPSYPLQDKQVLLHTDSARAYKAKTRGALHASVVHKKRQDAPGSETNTQPSSSQDIAMRARPLFEITTEPLHLPMQRLCGHGDHLELHHNDFAWCCMVLRCGSDNVPSSADKSQTFRRNYAKISTANVLCDAPIGMITNIIGPIPQRISSSPVAVLMLVLVLV